MAGLKESKFASILDLNFQENPQKYEEILKIFFGLIVIYILHWIPFMFNSQYSISIKYMDYSPIGPKKPNSG